MGNFEQLFQNYVNTENDYVDMSSVEVVDRYVHKLKTCEVAGRDSITAGSDGITAGSDGITGGSDGITDGSDGKLLAVMT